MQRQYSSGLCFGFVRLVENASPKDCLLHMWKRLKLCYSLRNALGTIMKLRSNKASISVCIKESLFVLYSYAKGITLNMLTSLRCFLLIITIIFIIPVKINCQ